MQNTVKAVTLPFVKYAMTEKMVTVIAVSLTIQDLCFKTHKKQLKNKSARNIGWIFCKTFEKLQFFLYNRVCKFLTDTFWRVK